VPFAPEEIVTRRPGVPLLIAIISIVVALLAASGLSDRVRWVDIVTLFGSGFGAGAGLVSALTRIRQAGHPVA
jgi:hypothetical protein